MSAIAWTYSTLLQALQDWPVHASNLYLANLPTIIGLGERRCWRDLNLEEYDKTDNSTVTMATGTRLVGKPTDTVQLRMVGFLDDPTSETNGKFAYLEQRSAEYCQIFAPDVTVEAVPQYYHEHSFDHIEVVPTPDQDYQMVFRYIGALPESLSSSAPTLTTWLSRAVPDVLLAACLAEAEQFIKADDRYQDFITKYNNELLPNARAELRKSIRRGDYAPPLAAAQPAQ